VASNKALKAAFKMRKDVKYAREGPLSTSRYPLRDFFWRSAIIDISPAVTKLKSGLDGSKVHLEVNGSATVPVPLIGSTATQLRRVEFNQSVIGIADTGIVGHCMLAPWPTPKFFKMKLP
jgi:hypothetical protein